VRREKLESLRQLVSALGMGMPDRDNWTAAMVLKWVLTRNQAGVVAMADTYGAVGVFEDGTVSHLVPKDMEAVLIEYCTDPTFAPGEERAAAAVVRSERAIEAIREMHAALCRGSLKTHSRRNGSGDVEEIDPSQWVSLKLQSCNGHDVAVPVDVQKQPLNLLREIADYIAGKVSPDSLPTVWPDPIFSADRVMQIWPKMQGDDPHAQCQETGEIERLAMDVSAVADANEDVQCAQHADRDIDGENPAPAAVVVPNETVSPAVPALESGDAPGEPGARTQAQRPDKVSDRDWQTYLSAVEKVHNLDISGNISKAARLIARDRQGPEQFQAARRGITRVLAALRKKI
jgi:hypothetical protein